MNLADTLHQHLLLCEEIHMLLLEENRILQTTQRPPNTAFLTRKSKLLPKLDAGRVALSIARMGAQCEVPMQHVALDRLQKKMLSILLLDRENEKLLLKYSLQAGALRVGAKPRAHLVSRAYSAAAAAA